MENKTTNPHAPMADTLPPMSLFSSGPSEIGLLMQILQELKVLNYQIGVLCKGTRP